MLHPHSFYARSGFTIDLGWEFSEIKSAYDEIQKQFYSLWETHLRGKSRENDEKEWFSYVFDRSDNFYVRHLFK